MYFERLKLTPLENYKTKRGGTYKYQGVARKRKAKDDKYKQSWNKKYDEQVALNNQIQESLNEKFGIFKGYDVSVKDKPAKQEIVRLAKMYETSQNQIIRIWENAWRAGWF